MEQKMLKKMRRLVWERIVKNGICWVQVCSAVAGIELLAPITWIQPPLRGVVTRASPSPKNIFMCPAFMRGATTGCVTRHWLSPTIPSISLGHIFYCAVCRFWGVFVPCHGRHAKTAAAQPSMHGFPCAWVCGANSATTAVPNWGAKRNSHMLQNISIVACSEAFKRIYRDKNCNNISVSKIHSLTQKKTQNYNSKSFNSCAILDGNTSINKCN